MEGYLGVVEDKMTQFQERLVALERVAGLALAQARNEIAEELYKAQHPGESDATTAAKQAIADHAAEVEAKKAELAKALADAEAADAAAKKAEEDKALADASAAKKADEESKAPAEADAPAL